MKKGIQWSVAIALAAVVVTSGFSQSGRPNARSVSELKKVQKQLQEDERAQAATKMLKSRLEGENTDTDDLIRQAQERLKALRSGDDPAKTATAKATPTAKPVTVARPAAVAPAPAPATPVRAAPVATPKPVAATSSTPPSNPAPVMKAAPAPAPTPAPTPAPAGAAASAAPALTSVANSNVPPPRPLTPRYDREDKGSQSMEITSDESEMDSANHLVTFKRNVIVKHPGFTLKAENLVIYMHEDENQPGDAPSGADEGRPPFKRAVATGPMVEIERIGAEGKVQIAKSRIADYDAYTGDMVLMGGPPTLQNGKSLIAPEEEKAKIFLTKEGKYRVEGKSKFIIDNVGGAKPGSSSGPSFGPSGLDSITNRNSR